MLEIDYILRRAIMFLMHVCWYIFVSLDVQPNQSNLGVIAAWNKFDRMLDV